MTEIYRSIPVFVSCPTKLNAEQTQKKDVIYKLLSKYHLVPITLGQGSFPNECPLKEVYILAKHCAGGLILGFEQIFISEGILKRGIEGESKPLNSVSMPTPWNNLEAGVLYGLKLPLLIFKENDLRGGVFDLGTTDVFIQDMPPAKPDNDKRKELEQIFLRWHGRVDSKYNEY